jgi:hypothetical protein
VDAARRFQAQRKEADRHRAALEARMRAEAIAAQNRVVYVHHGGGGGGCAVY